MTDLGILDTSTLERVPAMYGMEMTRLAAYYDFDEKKPQEEWNGILGDIHPMPAREPALVSLAQMLFGQKLATLRLGAEYLLLTKLVFTALVIPLSTASVERVFLRFKLIKVDHRNRLKTETLQHFLRIKMSCTKELLQSTCCEVAARWIAKKNQRMVTKYRVVSQSELKHWFTIG